MSNSDFFKDQYQIIHLDQLCNEWQLRNFLPLPWVPYKEKITLYWSEEEFKNGSNDGFFFRTGTDQNQTMLDVRWKMEDGIIVLAENGEVVETSFKLNTERDEFEKLTELINSVRKKLFVFILSGVKFQEPKDNQQINTNSQIPKNGDW